MLNLNAPVEKAVRMIEQTLVGEKILAGATK